MFLSDVPLGCFGQPPQPVSRKEAGLPVGTWLAYAFLSILLWILIALIVFSLAIGAAAETLAYPWKQRSGPMTTHLRNIFRR